VIAGTATAASRGVSRHIQAKQHVQDLRAHMAVMQAQQARAAMAAAPDAPALAPGTDMMADFEQLARLDEDRVWSDTEFQAAKSKLFGA
jgi:hypothetical protein